MSALHAAARTGDVAALTHALASGEDTNSKDNLKRTPLHMAAWAGHAAAVQLLLDSGAVVGSEATDGVTGALAKRNISQCDQADGRFAAAALHFACQKGHVDAARALLAGGGKVTCKTSKGATPLHYAAQSGCVRLVEILLRKRADLQAQNKQGKTPVDVATGEAKPLLELKLAEAAAAADKEPAAAGGDEAAEAEPVSAAEAVTDAAADGAADAAAAEPASAGSKRNSVAGATDAPDSSAPADAKRPKVNITFYDGEEQE